MNSRHHRDLECGNLCQRTLAFFRQRFGLFGSGTGGNHADIRPGNKRIRLAGDNHQPFQRRMLLRADQYVVDLLDKLGLQGVYLLPRNIDGDHTNVVRTKGQLKGRGFGPLFMQCVFKAHYSTSTIIAAPNPPAAQAVVSPSPPPRRFSSCNVWVIMRAPVAANG
ncbi:hypothetical protein D3C71_1580960 [compost metagenome]